MKVVVLEDLAAHFKLKTQNVIDRIQDLQIEGLLTGMFPIYSVACISNVNYY
jgi:hypothetical protein